MKQLLSLIAVVAALSPISAFGVEDVPGLTSSERRLAGKLQEKLQEKVGSNPKELVILDEFLRKLTTISATLDKDLTLENYKEHLINQTDEIFKKDEAHTDAWKSVRTEFFKLLFKEGQTELPTAAERASIRRAVVQAARLEVFRLQGHDNKSFTPDEEALIREVSKALFTTTNINDDSNQGRAPFIDKNKASTLRALIKTFEEHEQGFDSTMTLKMYKQLVRTKSDRVFDGIRRTTYKDAWKNGREWLFNRLDQQVGLAPRPPADPAPPEAALLDNATRPTFQLTNLPSAEEGAEGEAGAAAGAAEVQATPEQLARFRGLIRGPVLRVLQLELVRVAGLQAVRGPLTGSGSGILAGSASSGSTGTTRSGKRRSKLGCLECLKFLLPFPPQK